MANQYYSPQPSSLDVGMKAPSKLHLSLDPGSDCVGVRD